MNVVGRGADENQETPKAASQPPHSKTLRDSDAVPSFAAASWSAVYLGFHRSFALSSRLDKPSVIWLFWVNMSSQRKPHRTEPPLQKADWTAWTLHLIFGGVVGFGIGWLIAMRLMEADLIGDAQLVYSVLATALILAGLSSHYGERLYGMIPSVFSPDAPPRSHRSWLASCAVTSMGALLLVAIVGWHLNETAGDYHWEPGAIGIIMVPFILGLPVLIFYALREGRLLTIYGVIDRYEDPLWYFIWTMGYGIAWLGLILATFRG